MKTQDALEALRGGLEFAKFVDAEAREMYFNAVNSLIADLIDARYDMSIVTHEKFEALTTMVEEYRSEFFDDEDEDDDTEDGEDDDDSLEDDDDDDIDDEDLEDMDLEDDVDDDDEDEDVDVI